MVRHDEKIFLKKNGQTLSCLEASEGEVIVMKVASTTAAPTRPINFHQFTFLQENSDRLYIFWGAAILYLLYITAFGPNLATELKLKGFMGSFMIFHSSAPQYLMSCVKLVHDINYTLCMFMLLMF